MKSFPPQLKAEVKFSTGTMVSVPEREWQALQPEADAVVGVIAVMSLAGNREFDGEWIVVDAARAFPERKAGPITLQVGDLARMAERQKPLHSLRQAIGAAWRPYLHTYLGHAIASRAALQLELSGRQRGGTLGQLMCSDPILDCDHLSHLRQIVDTHGEGVAGGVFQELFAYLLGYLGYTNVISNPIGVPDIMASGLAEGIPKGVAEFTPRELVRLAELCEEGGELELAVRLRGLSRAP